MNNEMMPNYFILFRHEVLKKSLLLIFLSFGLQISAQQVEQSKISWIATNGGQDASVIGISVHTDSSRNIYHAGIFQGTADFDPGPDTLELSAMGIRDGFISKSNPEGNLIWVKQLGGGTNLWVDKMLPDHEGNLILTGAFSGTMDFDPGPGNESRTSLRSTDLFLLKLDKDGQFMWVQTIGVSNFLPYIGVSLAIDKFNNIICGGIFTETNDFDPGPGTFNMSASGFYDLFVLKLDQDGIFQWAKKMGGESTQEDINYITIDSTGAVLICGAFGTAMDFDPGPGTFMITPQEYDAFILKLNASGDFSWVVTLGSAGTFNYASSAKTDSSNNIIVAGVFEGTIDFNPGPGVFNMTPIGNQDIFVLNLTQTGSFQWAKQIGGSAYAINPLLHLDDSMDIYIAGSFGGSVDLNPGPASYTIVSNGKPDAFLAKWKNDGTFVWGHHVAGLNSDKDIYAIDSDSALNIVITGFFDDFTDFNNNSGRDTLHPIGANDLFLIKLIQCLSSEATIDISACDNYLSPSGRYLWDTGGVYMDTIPNAAGCDSFMVINLSILESSFSNISVSICEGDSYVAPGGIILELSGVYQVTIPNQAGCDSIITIDLEVRPVIHTVINITACNVYFAPDGNMYNSSGTYIDTLTSSEGCDSVVTLVLIINHDSFFSDEVTACDRYLAPNGLTYWDTSGVYSDTIPNSSGCDSIITIDLNILRSSTSSPQVLACESYTSPSGNFTWITDGIYLDTIPNAVGCDSILIIYLTMDTLETIQLTETACQSYTSPSGNYIWTESGIFLDTIPQTIGCDEYFSIELTIIKIDTTLIWDGSFLSATESAATYQWYDCDSGEMLESETNRTFMPSESGDYAVLITKDNCTILSECLSVTIVSTDNIANKDAPVIYPNPVAEKLYIKSEFLLNDALVMIHDTHGKTVLSSSLSCHDGCNINMHGIFPGLYILTILTDNKVYRFKIIKV